MSTRHLLKSLYYRWLPESLPPETRLTLGYVFHTEAIYDARLFAQLEHFLGDYQALTGKRAMCTIMTPENARVRQGMLKHGCAESQYVERVHRIQRLAGLGLHGHFTFSHEHFSLPEAEIRCNNFSAAAVRSQLAAETAWFTRHGLRHDGLYSAGWWFMNAFVQQSLIEHGFAYDFSISQSRWFRNQYSHRLMLEQKIPTGRPFRIRSAQGSLTCIQNLVGCHTTPFPQDYLRHVRWLLTPGWHDCVAVSHSHDFDLDPPNTLRCLETLKGNPQVSFFDAADLPSLLAAREVPEIPLAVLAPRFSLGAASSPPAARETSP